MLSVQHHVRYVYGRLALTLALELLPQLEEPVLDLVLDVRVELLLPADQLRLRILLLGRHGRRGQLQVHTAYT